MVLRIVSLLPSATELLHFLLVRINAQYPPESPAAVLVGRSHECDWPPEYASLPVLTASRIKGTSCADIDRQVRDELAAGMSLYSVDTATLLALQPDLVVTQSLCQICTVNYAQVAALLEVIEPRPRIVDTNPGCIQDVLMDIQRLADAMGESGVGRDLVLDLQTRLDAALLHVTHPTGLKIGFLEWTDPLFCGGHWTPQLIEMAGALHPLNPTRGLHQGAPPSRMIPAYDFVAMDPDIIIVAPCGMEMPPTETETAAL
ncbi:Aste57867_9727 [Aphanomyces stellatus]|uniref:Aste57867_9727 protein n=1 Tax=Aphanomyces stellatus TaxID=120398 RepID=A0A485KNZ5_9STRA|nr:hypothetical protein As57867_009689 [Aphanomyces stellatus]VFT86606.1 Aste57867_9727 [Aphanomyces stellatus]